MRNVVNVIRVLLGITGFLLGSSLGNSAPTVVVVDRWYQCGTTLATSAGKSPAESRSLPLTVQQYSVDRSTEFTELLLALIYVESRYQPTARSHAGAYGLTQMTAPAVTVARGVCGLRPLSGGMTDLHHVPTSVVYGSCYLRYLLTATGGDTERALIAYNGGYRQLANYNAGKSIASETANYVLRVRKALRECRAGT
jgi:soluble lytic murein transglycosylase-like protein